MIMSSYNNLPDEDKILCLHISDMISLCEKRHNKLFSDFLNERQMSLALSVLKEHGVSSYLFWGGYENADHTMLCVYPEYDSADKSEFPFKRLNLKYRKTDKLTHRDFLGSLMALGIEREAVGDIVVGEGLTSVFVKSELASYVEMQITKIGRVGVSFTDLEENLDAVSQEYEEKEHTVSSLRADSVVSAVTGLSRSKSRDLIETGLTAVNFEIITSADKKISDNDRISVRGYGKYIIISDGSMSRKGKYRITVKRYK